MNRSARWDKPNLTITTEAKRGKKTVKKTVAYNVADVSSDLGVSFPVFLLTKTGEDLDGKVSMFTGEAYTVSFDPATGSHCSCQQYKFTFQCKHVLAIKAVGINNLQEVIT